MDDYLLFGSVIVPFVLWWRVAYSFGNRVSVKRIVTFDWGTRSSKLLAWLIVSVVVATPLFVLQLPSEPGFRQGFTTPWLWTPGVHPMATPFGPSNLIFQVWKIQTTNYPTKVKGECGSQQRDVIALSWKHWTTVARHTPVILPLRYLIFHFQMKKARGHPWETTLHCCPFRHFNIPITSSSTYSYHTIMALVCDQRMSWTWKNWPRLGRSSLTERATSPRWNIT